MSKLSRCHIYSVLWYVRHKLPVNEDPIGARFRSSTPWDQEFRLKTVTPVEIEDLSSGTPRKFPQREKALDMRLTACKYTRSEVVRR